MEANPNLRLEDLEIRRSEPSDDPAIMTLMREALGWRAEDPNESLFEWKHRQNPFGPSPAWVALHDGRVVGFRTFMRWEFRRSDGSVLKSVRAVDTATANNYRGMGIFRSLTLKGCEELTSSGISFVFNTPNSQSRPGYLQMGWTVDRSLPVGMLTIRPASIANILRSRVPAQLMSEPCSVGQDPAEVLADSALMARLLAPSSRVRIETCRTQSWLSWRTSPSFLHYRILLCNGTKSEPGLIVFRLRRRGPAKEVVVGETFGLNPRRATRCILQILRETGADYAIGIRQGALSLMVGLPRQGPVLSTRPLALAAPSPGDLRLSMLDVELM